MSTADSPLPADSNTSVSRHHRAGRYGILLVLALALLPNLAWILLDRSVWPFDPAWYGEMSISLYRTLRVEPREWADSLLTVFGIKAPAIAWLGQFFVPLRKVTGTFESALLLLPLLSSVFSSLLIYSLLTRIWPENRGSCFCGALLTLAAPLNAGLSHYYFVESMQLFCVSAIVWLLTLPLSAIELFAALTLLGFSGLAVKVSTPLYIAIPGLAALYLLIARRLLSMSRPRLFKYLWRIALCVSLLTIFWYWRNWHTMSEFLKTTSAGEVASHYGSAAPFLVKLEFWLKQAALAFFSGSYAGLLWLMFLVCGASVFCLKRGKAEGGTEKQNIPPVVWVVIALLEIALTLAVFSKQVNEETRYLLPLLPYLAVLTTFAAVQLGSGGKALLFTAAALQYLFVQSISLGYLETDNLRKSPWLNPYKSDSSDAERLTALVDQTCRSEKANSYNIIGISLSSFNANSASFYMLKKQLSQGLLYRCYYTSLGYVESDAQKAWNRMLELNTAAVAFRTDVQPERGDAFNAVTEEIRGRLSGWQCAKRVPVPAHAEIELFGLESGPHCVN